MKKGCCLIIAFFVIWGIFGGANAALVSYDADAIRDTTTGLLWWKDLSDFNNKTYDQQKTFIASLGGGWHMATEIEIANLISGSSATEMDDMFIPVFTSNSGNYHEFYDGRYDEPGFSVDEHKYVDFKTFNALGGVPAESYNVTYGWSTPDSYSVNSFGAWATTAVPIPSALWFLGSGLIGIVGVRKKFKK